MNFLKITLISVLFIQRSNQSEYFYQKHEDKAPSNSHFYHTKYQTRHGFMNCLALCNQEKGCLSISLNKATNECVLFKALIYDFTYKNGNLMFVKKTESPIYNAELVFNHNTTQKLNISNIGNFSLSMLTDVVEVLVNSTSYFYVADNSNGQILKLSIQLQFVTSAVLIGVYEIARGHQSIFATTWSTNLLYQYDFSLNYLLYHLLPTDIRSLFFDLIEKKLYVGAHSSNVIYIYDCLDENQISLNETLQMSSGEIMDIFVENDYIYVSAMNESIHVFDKNTSLIKTYSDACSLGFINIHSIQIDFFGNLIFTCEQLQKVCMISARNDTISCFSSDGNSLVAYLDTRNRLLVGSANYGLLVY